MTNQRKAQHVKATAITFVIGMIMLGIFMICVTVPKFVAAVLCLGGAAVFFTVVYNAVLDCVTEADEQRTQEY